MFIELTEYLRCPSGHGDEYLVLTPDAMRGRTVLAGTLGCPRCKRAFRVEEQIVHLGKRNGDTPNTETVEAADVQALLDINGPGGYVALVGSAAGLGDTLAGLVEDVRFVGLDAPATVQPSERLSLIEGDPGVPLRSQIARGIVVGGEQDMERLEDAARVLLKGRRLVVLGGGGGGEPPALPQRVRLLAAGNGLTVGEKI